MFRLNFIVEEKLTPSHSHLIIGCGRSHCNPLHSKSLHSSDNYYTIDKDKNIKPHLIGDIRDDSVINYLGKQRFDLIAIESVPELVINDDKSRKPLIDKLFSLLKDNGVLAIIASGNLKNDSVLYDILFQHVKSITLHSTYHKNIPYPTTCSIIAAKSEAMSQESSNYIEQAFKIKFLNNSAILKIEKDIIYKPLQINLNHR